MSRALDLFPSSTDPSAVLSGGRAPVCWRHDLSRVTEPLAVLRKASGWCEELAGAHPRLCDKPLLGDCLAGVLEREAPPQSFPLEKPRRRPATVSQPGRACPPERAERDLHTLSPPEPICSPLRRTADARPELSWTTANAAPRSADRPLLCRLAGESEKVTGDEPRPARSIEPHLHCAAPKPAPVVGDRSERALLDCVSQRATRAVHEFTVPRIQGAAGSPAGQPELGTSPSLADQYSMSLEGPRVPAQLLTQLAALTPDGRSLSTVERAVNAGQPGSQSTPTQSPSVQQGRDALSASRIPTLHEPHTRAPGRANRQREITHSASSGTETKGSTTMPGTNPSREHSEPPLLPISPELSLAVDDEGDSLTLPRIAPPGLTPLLPPLKSPSTTGSPVLPVAAATARISAKRAEDAARGEDLSILAAQINRILNEEARRHGIDV